VVSELARARYPDQAIPQVDVAWWPPIPTKAIQFLRRVQLCSRCKPDGGRNPEIVKETLLLTEQFLP